MERYANEQKCSKKKLPKKADFSHFFYLKLAPEFKTLINILVHQTWAEALTYSNVLVMYNNKTMNAALELTQRSSEIHNEMILITISSHDLSNTKNMQANKLLLSTKINTLSTCIVTVMYNNRFYNLMYHTNFFILHRIWYFTLCACKCSISALK